MTVHRFLTREEHRQVSEAARNGASFDRPETACRTGDGHARGHENWNNVNCPACLSARGQRGMPK
jgi:hypothetical protein